MSRYHRQELIDGWDQEKLRNAKVAIVGDGKLAEYVAIPLAALGVGEIRIIGNGASRKFLDFDDPKSASKKLVPKPRMHSGKSPREYPLSSRKTDETRNRILAADMASEPKYLANCIEKLNPDIKATGYIGGLANEASKYMLNGMDIVIDATNDSFSKSLASDFEQYISITGSGNAGMVSSKKDVKRKEHVFSIIGEEDALLSIVLGGLAAGEAKRMLMGEEVSEDPIIYNKFSGMGGIEKREPKGADYSGKNVLVVGAGALGNFVALGLTELGIGKVDIIDDDAIEDTNLNRQILYYDSVGKGKAKTLAKKMGYIDNDMEIKAFEKKFDEGFDGKYDLIFDCVDNFATRALMSDFASKKKIPLVSGGTDWKGGQVAVYVPGKACLDCQMDLKKSAKKREESQSCVYAPNPSVIFTNQTIAGMMVNEAVRIFENDGILRGRRGYDSEMNGRLGKTDTMGECEHG